MRTLLFSLLAAISLPLIVLAQSRSDPTVLLQEANLDGVMGSTQTFYFNVSGPDELLVIDFAVLDGDANTQIETANATGNSNALYSYGQSGLIAIPNVPAGSYKAVVTGMTDYDDFSFDIEDYGLSATFLTGEIALANGVYYLAFPTGNYFGYYSFLASPAYIYHFDLGYEYLFDAEDGEDGVYFYDFSSNDFFYTSPSFPFPYLYDFNLKSVLYYYPDTSNAGHYTTDPRYFYDYATSQIITK